MTQNNVCQCGCFYMSDTGSRIRINKILHSIEMCGLDTQEKSEGVPTLTEAYQQGRDDEHQELLKFINEVRDVIRKPYDFRSSVELVMRKEMLERLCDQAEGIEYYDEYSQEN